MRIHQQCFNRHFNKCPSSELSTSVAWAAKTRNRNITTTFAIAQDRTFSMVVGSSMTSSIFYVHSFLHIL